MKKANQILILSALLLTFMITKSINVMQDTEEIWKQYNDLLEVSNLGKVRTIDRVVLGKGYKNSTTRKLIKSKLRVIQFIHKYPSIRDRKQFLRVHRMVAKCFVANPENKPEVNHKDGNKLNNHYSNLEWCTRSENQQHAVINGLIKPVKGQDHWNNKLDQIQVLVIRRCLKEGITQQKIADYFMVHRTCISAIKLGYHWSHLS